MMVNKADLFRAYNSAMVLARAGAIDVARLRKALGVAQRTKPRPVSYITGVEYCSCPDKFYNHPRACKHMLSALLIQMAKEIAA